MIRKIVAVGFMLSILMAGESQISSADSPKEFTLVAMVEGGAKIWSPATLTISKGESVKLMLKNTTDAEHGFSIDELNVKEVIPAGGTKEITVKADSAGALRYYCHLHKAHVGGQLLVQ
ncbi:MAG: cupredoxin domain-containing protein [Nitrospirae bacterium]|nr:cupredoxin domain-containing protein [Nitrospirota bacterium]